ncbi:MAG: amidohydrolase family protein [Bifidobacterium sp.]|jgi:imidazolonepropionase-like amidohydrolase|nr:amidohydrolase family protein [Bifidobacterium sp.]
MVHEDEPSGLISGLPIWDGERCLGPATIRWHGDVIDEVSATENSRDAGVSGTRRHSSMTDPGRLATSSSASAAGLSIIPGLVDTHLHLEYPSDPTVKDTFPWGLYTPPEEMSLHVLANAQECARFGVTTMRDMASHAVEMAVSRSLESGVIRGPRVLADGEVGMTAGHGDLFTPPHAIQRNPTADSPDECRKLVRIWARAGTTGIKIYLSGGVLSLGDKVGWRNQTRAEIRATIDEAHALGMQVAAHCHTEQSVQIALDEGVDSIEHATAMTEAQMHAIAERRIPVGPTLLINDVIAYRSPNASEAARSKARQIVAGRNETFRKAAEIGVRFVLGTDASRIWVAYGDQMEEVRFMAEVFGWSAQRALVAATRDAADSMRLDGKVGRLAPGAGVDFIVMNGRPWEHIEDLDVDNIVAVVSRGRVIRGSLEGIGARRG